MVVIKNEFEVILIVLLYCLAVKQQPANRTHNLQLHTIPTT